MRSKVDAVYKQDQKSYAQNMHNGFRGWLKEKYVKLICLLKGLKSDIEKLTVLPHATTADVFPWQQCVRVRHPKHWAGGRLNNGSHPCCVLYLKCLFTYIKHMSECMRVCKLVIDRYWFFISDTDYLYVYVPDNRYAEPIFIYCYKVNK